MSPRSCMPTSTILPSVRLNTMLLGQRAQIAGIKRGIELKRVDDMPIGESRHFGRGWMNLFASAAAVLIEKSAKSRARRAGWRGASHDGNGAIPSPGR